VQKAIGIGRRNKADEFSKPAVNGAGKAKAKAKAKVAIASDSEGSAQS